MTARQEAIEAIVRSFSDSDDPDEVWEAIKDTFEANGYDPTFEHILDAIPATVMARLALERGTPAGADLLNQLDRSPNAHPLRNDCPGCGESISLTGVVHLAYTFDTCGCDLADYEHLVERIWHLACLNPAAPDLAAVEMLRIARDIAARYVRGEDTARRIDQFLAGRTTCPTCGRQRVHALSAVPAGNADQYCWGPHKENAGG